jgi:cytochrome c553
LGRLGCAFVALVLASAASAQPKSGEAERAEWNAADREKEQALQLHGDAAAGAAAYEVCAACHLPNGAGRADGTFPQLAGQHATVLVKQIADIRADRRDAPIMHPYAMTLVDPQEIADVAAYLAGLPIPSAGGRGPGGDLEQGRRLYERDCVRCHGGQGEGSAEKFYPVLAGQHYEYALRQLRDIAGRRRRNANPEMVKAVRGYTDAELQAVADYATRLAWPGRAEKSAD